METAEANVATAQMTADSKEELFKENVVSQFDLQTARNSLRSAKASLAQARAELTNAQNNLSYTEIKSPVDGTAGMSSYRIGALVSPSISSPLISVSDQRGDVCLFLHDGEADTLPLASERFSDERLGNNAPGRAMVERPGANIRKKAVLTPSAVL